MKRGISGDTLTGGEAKKGCDVIKYVNQKKADSGREPESAEIRKSEKFLKNNHLKRRAHENPATPLIRRSIHVMRILAGP